MKQAINISLLVIMASLLGFKSEPEPTIIVQSNLPEYNVALFLPLHLHDYKRRESDTSSAIYDYYEGVQAAINELELMGLNMRLHVFDTELDSIRTDSLFKLPIMRIMNTIVGPIYTINHSIAERFCAKSKIPLISPFIHFNRTLDDTFPHINIIPSDSIAAFGLGQGMARLYPNNKLLVISDNKSSHYKMRKLFKEGFGLVSKREIIQISQSNLSKLYSLSNKSQLVVYAPTDSLPVLQKLANLAAIGKVKLALPKDVKKIKGFGKNQMIRGKVHFEDNNFYDKYESRALEFRKMYRRVYRWEANSYHFKGYDQFMWLGQSLMTFKQSYPSGLGNAHYSGIMQQFSLKACNNGGYENAGAKILYYNSEGIRIEL